MTAHDRCPVLSGPRERSCYFFPIWISQASDFILINLNLNNILEQSEPRSFSSQQVLCHRIKSRCASSTWKRKQIKWRQWRRRENVFYWKRLIGSGTNIDSMLKIKWTHRKKLPRSWANTKKNFSVKLHKANHLGISHKILALRNCHKTLKSFSRSRKAFY